MAKQRTPEQQQRDQERLAAMQTPPEELAAATEVIPAVSLNTMLGIGGRVTLGGKEYDVPPYPLKQQQRAYEKLLAVDELFSTHALATLDGNDFEVRRTTEMLNRFREAARAAGEDAPTLTEDEVAVALASRSFPVAEEDAAAMTEFVHFTLRLAAPEVTPEQIEAALDVPTFLHFLRVVFQVNGGFARRFPPPG